ncbi:MAG: hypothetical protein GJV46_10435 [Geobacter sp.]|nr:hypothetical protein [Geobacter sp.]
MRYSINLASTTYIDRRLINRSCFGIIALLVVLLCWNVTKASWTFSEQRRINTEIKALEGRLINKPGGVSDKEFAQQRSQIGFYNEIIDRKSKDWLKLLDMIEGVTPDGVSLATIAQGKKKDELALEGRAKSFGNVRQYLEKLEESKGFANVLLLSHQEFVTADKGRAVQFKISCKVQY